MCNHYVPAKEGEKPSRYKLSTVGKVPVMSMGEANGGFAPLTQRGILEETCRKYGYWVGKVNNILYHFANYVSEEGVIVGQKLRDKDKQFKVRGKVSDKMLFGKHLWNGGKKIIITEGEIDCLTVAQLQGCKYPVVSLPLGSNSAKKCMAANIEYLDQFEEIILMFDQDEAGQKAVKEAAEVLPSGKTFIAVLPLKDANECLLAGRAKEVIEAIWNANPYVPDGVVSASDMKSRVKGKD